MAFASIEFLIFFVVVLLVRQCVSTPMKTWVVLLASYLFYMTGSVPGVLLIIAISVVDYCVGRKLAAKEDETVRRRLLYVSLGCNLGILVFFKYANFAVENLNVVLGTVGLRLPLSPHNAVLLPAISYFTFTSLSYVLDIYYERLTPARSLSDYLLYVAYFPKLLAGPIARAGDFLAQLRERVPVSAADIEIGAARFLMGAVKKAAIADQIAPHVDLIFSAPGQYDGFTLLQGVLGYAIQIYCDFSGYTDMAIGCARMMGIRLPENFLLPYAASNITEFWRRWHITLSNWFRDYVFIPLEMSTRSIRRVNVRTSLNLLLTMLLCGLWHGASWNFVIWGGLHGAALAVNRVWSTFRMTTRPRQVHFGRQIFSNVLSRCLTLSVVLVGWIFFRSESFHGAVQYLLGILTWRAGIHVASPYILAAIPVVILGQLVYSGRNWAEHLFEHGLTIRVAAYSTLLLLLATLGGTEATPFLYLQF